MLKLKINDANEILKLKNKEFQSLFNKTKKIVDRPIPHLGFIELSFASRKEIKVLNRQYRSKDKETDVLSFDFWTKTKRIDDFDLVGEIIICTDISMIQAEEHGWDVQDEVYFLFVHGLLHVFGYDHEEKDDFLRMFGIQLQIMPDKRAEKFVREIFLQHWTD